MCGHDNWESVSSFAYNTIYKYNGGSFRRWCRRTLLKNPRKLGIIKKYHIADNEFDIISTGKQNGRYKMTDNSRKYSFFGKNNYSRVLALSKYEFVLSIIRNKIKLLKRYTII